MRVSNKVSVIKGKSTHLRHYFLVFHPPTPSRLSVLDAGFGVDADAGPTPGRLFGVGGDPYQIRQLQDQTQRKGSKYCSRSDVTCLLLEVMEASSSSAVWGMWSVERWWVRSSQSCYLVVGFVFLFP